jgi:hypothetical protein
MRPNAAHAQQPLELPGAWPQRRRIGAHELRWFDSPLDSAAWRGLATTGFGVGNAPGAAAPRGAAGCSPASGRRSEQETPLNDVGHHRWRPRAPQPSGRMPPCRNVGEPWMCTASAQRIFVRCTASRIGAGGYSAKL